MKYTIKIDVKTYGTTTRIVGFVNDDEVIGLSNQILGKWHTSASTCLPSDIKKAKQYVMCMNEAFEVAEKYGAMS